MGLIYSQIISGYHFTKITLSRCRSPLTTLATPLPSPANPIFSLSHPSSAPSHYVFKETNQEKIENCISGDPIIDSFRDKPINRSNQILLVFAPINCNMNQKNPKLESTRVTLSISKLQTPNMGIRLSEICIQFEESTTPLQFLTEITSKKFKLEVEMSYNITICRD